MRNIALIFMVAFMLLLSTAGAAFAQQSVSIGPGESVTVESTLPDTDGDGAPDPLQNSDNCVSVSNPEQTNTDNDTQGNACDDDDDNDGRDDSSDYAPLDPAIQDNPDTDGDGVADTEDNCDELSNPEQTNTDGDEQGNACDADDDNDGRDDANDFDPLDPNVQDNPDSDGDGVADTNDNCVAVQNSDQGNIDEDTFGDACDSDKDGDGFQNAVDNKPDEYNPNQSDLDGDKIGDFADDDKDGDGVPNHLDPAPRDANIPNNSGGLPADCENVISPSEDMDAIVNGDPSGEATKFCAEAGNHTVDNIVVLKSGDTITGPIGTQVQRGPALYGSPTANVVGNGVDKVFAVNGGNTTIAWLDISGGDGRMNLDASSSDCPSSNSTNGCPVVGTGIGIALGQGDGSGLVSNVRVHDNDAAGISNAMGVIRNSELYGNTADSRFLGVVGSAIKGITEFEAAFNYVHNEQGNGIWHDHSLSGEGNNSFMANNPGGGTWFHDNLVVNNGRWGLRFEYSPRNATEGQHLATPTFMAEKNRMAGNGSGGASHRDAQNGTWRSNTFGAGTISGVTYAKDTGSAIVASDSGRDDRTDLWNADILNNTLNGEPLKGCELADTIVDCQNNTP